MNLWQDRLWGPMLLKEVAEPFDSPDFLYEIKFDGIRAICFASSNKVTIISRNHKDLTHLFPELQEIKKLVKKNVIFDGEIVSMDKKGPSFSKMQERIHLKNKVSIKEKSLEDPVLFIAFDILYESKNLINLSLVERKKYLAKYQDNDVFIKTKTYQEGTKLFKEIKKLGLEGIVAKNKNSPYSISQRTDDFIKIKNIKREEYLIGGFIDEPKVNVVTIALGHFKNKNFYYVGKVIVSKKKELYQYLNRTKKTKNFFVDKEDDKMIFVKPQIECYIEFLEKTKSGHLRHAKFKGVKSYG